MGPDQLQSAKNMGGRARDVLQGASNAVASNVSAPVDGLAWGLKKMGVPISAKPMGGSDWMSEKGLTAEPQSKMAGAIGEFAGMAGPMAAAAKAPQLARGLLQMGENAMVPRTMNPQTGALRIGDKPFAYPQGAALETARQNGVKTLGLPENNTAMDRALALGFNTDAFHGTEKQLTGGLRRSQTGAQGPGAYLGDDAMVAAAYAGDQKGANVLPALIKGKYMTNKEFTDIVNSHGWGGAEQEAIKRGFAGVHDTMFESAFNVYNPANIRSRFAAFDPARVKESDLLGRADPALLGLIGGGVGAGLVGNRILERNGAPIKKSGVP